MNLQDKVVIVTGASRGIGRDMALRFAAEGARVVVAAKTDKPHGQLPGTIHETVQDITDAGGQALAVRTDLRDEESVKALVSGTIGEFGRIDVVVNNAGALFWAPALETETRRLDLVLGVNIRGSYILSCAAARQMVEQGDGGAIVMVSPPIDVVAHPGMVGYWISKQGMTMAAIGLAGELRPHGIAVNSLWPATLIESQATIHHRFGAPPLWRKPTIMSDAIIAVISKGHTFTGNQLVDEDFLRAEGVSDFTGYRCVEDSEPPRVDYSDMSIFMSE